MNREQKNVVIEFASSLSEEDLRNLTLGLVERMGGDLGKAVEFMSEDRRMDQLLASAPTANQFYQLCDDIRDCILKECRRKGLLLKLNMSVA